MASSAFSSLSVTRAGDASKLNRLAVVVGAQHQRNVLERHHDHQDPEDRRASAEDRLRVHGDAVLGIERFLDGVERARADVAVHDAQGEERESRGGMTRGGAFMRRDACKRGSGGVHGGEA
jgi:hypothetical protein